METVKQAHNWDCGLACCAMALNYFKCDTYSPQGTDDIDAQEAKTALNHEEGSDEPTHAPKRVLTSTATTADGDGDAAAKEGGQLLSMADVNNEWLKKRKGGAWTIELQDFLLESYALPSVLCTSMPGVVDAYMDTIPFYQQTGVNPCVKELFKHAKPEDLGVCTLSLDDLSFLTHKTRVLEDDKEEDTENSNADGVEDGARPKSERGALRQYAVIVLINIVGLCCDTCGRYPVDLSEPYIGHYVVLERITETHVEYRDPGRHRCAETCRASHDAFNKARHAEGTDNDVLIVYPPRSKSGGSDGDCNNSDGDGYGDDSSWTTVLNPLLNAASPLHKYFRVDSDGGPGQLEQ